MNIGEENRITGYKRQYGGAPEKGVKKGRVLQELSPYTVGSLKSNTTFQYLENPPDIARSVRGVEEKLVVANVSKISKDALGVFAVKPIEKGQLLGEYLGEKIDESVEEDETYAFMLSDNSVLSATKKGNWTRFFNHSEKFSNVALEEKEHRIFFKAKVAINAGEQLLINYGKEYFSHKDFIPVTLLPEDGYETAQEIKHRKSYSTTRVIDGSTYYVTPVIQAILDNKLADLKRLSREDLALPALPCEANAPLDRKTPLHLAVLAGNIEIISFLLQQGQVSKHQVTTNNQTALHLAFSTKDPFPIVQLLMNHGLDVYAQQLDGKTPLHLAIEKNDLKTVQLLIATSNQNAIRLAIQLFRMEILNVLLENVHSVPMNLIQETKLLHTVCLVVDKELCLSLMQKIVKNKSPQQFKKCCHIDETGRSPLCILYQLDNEIAYEFLLSQYDQQMMEHELEFYLNYVRGVRRIDYLEFLVDNFEINNPQKNETIIDRLANLTVKAQLIAELWPENKTLKFLEEEIKKGPSVSHKNFLRAIVNEYENHHPALKRFINIKKSLE